MLLDSTMSVRDVALNFAQAPRVLEELRIDYCCGGDQPLGQACSLAGVKVERLEQMLDEAARRDASGTNEIDFKSLGLTELIDHIIKKHHVYTKAEMKRLSALLEQVFIAHGTNHSELGDIRETFRRLCADLEPHMFKEENILFPYIVALDMAVRQNDPLPFAPFGTVNNPIRMMMMEHDTAGEMLRELRRLSADYQVPKDGCISYQTLYQAMETFEQDLHQHIHLENNLLFPKAVALEANL